MHVSRRPRFGAAAALVLWAWAVPAAALDRHASPRPSAHALCEDAIAAAGRAPTMPPHLLLSIARAESGRVDPDTGRVRPWPWTINADGLGSYFPTMDAAVAAVTALQARGVQSIDVGCMQINLRHHPRAFASLHEAFDPVTNARYAVRFLEALHRQGGDWVQATAAYHSQTHELGARYVQTVLGPLAKGFAPLRAARQLDRVMPPDRSYAAPGQLAGGKLPEVAIAGLAPPGLTGSERGLPGLACPVGRC